MNEQNKSRLMPYSAAGCTEHKNCHTENCELIQDRCKLGSMLCLAILRGDNRTAEHLLNAGAPVNHQEDPDGWTPLIYSVYYHNPDGRKLLLSRGADLHQTDFSGRTLLMFAVQNNERALAEELLHYGVSPTVRDCTGRSALDFATSGKCPECIDLLAGDPFRQK